MDPLKIVVIELTAFQAKLLSDILWSHTDCGPDGLGWASDQLSALRFLVDHPVKTYEVE